jgi:hypothetical protein
MSMHTLARNKEVTMPVFPEHIHIEGEDRLLKRTEHEDQYRLVLDGLFAAVVVSVLSLVAAIAVLMLI